MFSKTLSLIDHTPTRNLLIGLYYRELSECRAAFPASARVLLGCVRMERYSLNIAARLPR